MPSDLPPDSPPPEAPTSVEAKAEAKQRSRLMRGVLISIGVVVLVIGLLSGTVGALFWAAGSATGTAWLLARLSVAGIGVDVIEPEGTLIGDLKAKQIIITAGGTRIVIDRPVWSHLSVSYTREPNTWGRVHVDSLTADRVTVTVTPSQTSSSKPPTLPTKLRLPMELQVDDFRVAEAWLPGLEGRPLRKVHAKLQFGADHGRQHRIDDLGLELEPMQLAGHVRIGAEAPMALDVDLRAVQSASASGSPATTSLPTWAKTLRADWQAELKAEGPLARFNTQAKLRAQGQSLDATAQVAPIEPWPLPQLDATTQGLDLSALLEKAPLTSLSGTVRIAAPDKAKPRELSAHADLSNAKPGRWDAQQLPVATLKLDARASTDRFDSIELTKFEAELSDGRAPAGTLQGSARWNAGEFDVQADLTKLQPGALDSHLAAMVLSGPIKVSGKTHPKTTSGDSVLPTFTALADLNGHLVSPSRAVQLKLDAAGTEERVELRELRASAGGARATVTGTADRQASAWQMKAKAALVDFDPRVWLPTGPGSGWQDGNHRINLNGDLALNVPDTIRLANEADKRTLVDRLAGLRGEATVKVDNSVVADVPLAGNVALRHANVADPLSTNLELDVGGNHIKLDGQLTPDAVGSKDHWSAEARAPTLARLVPLLRLVVPPGEAAALVQGLSGTLNADVEANGRWPELTSKGQASLASVRAGSWAVGQGEAHWQFSSTADAPLDVQLDIGQAAWSNKQIGNTVLSLKGSAASHDFSLRTELKAAPPVWVDSVQGRVQVAPATPIPATGSASAVAAAAAATAAAAPPPARTLLSANAHGSLSGGVLAGRSANAKEPETPWAWKGVLQQLELRTTQPGAVPMLLTKNVGVEVTGGPATRAIVSAGRADIVGAGLRWNRIDWQSGQGVQTQQLDMQAELEPLDVAPLMRRIQPNFGWGGDLQIAGKVVVHQTDKFSADIVLERTRGDLTVTEESGTRALGLSDLRVGLNAEDGVWNFTAGLAGQQLGVLGGAMVVHTSPQQAWPSADAPVQGVLEAQVANLGTWGAWVPAGWRLDGKLNVSASLGGKFNHPEYTGEVRGSGIGVRNTVEGVNLTDGEVDISLRGNTAKINKFIAHGGSGTVRLEGDANLDDTWHSRLKLVADKFQLLGRVDLRVVASGEGQVAIDGDIIKADGSFTADEGLIDFTRLSSPSLSDDVVVTGRPNDSGEPPALPNAASANKLTVDLLVNLGNNLRMRGLGIDTRLTGELRVSHPNGKWALNGTVNAVDGTFANYGQKLEISRGVITFNGAPSDMRLDIEATRPNLDVRVGVQVTGPLQNLRVRLFSEPDMTNNEKLSWLLLGRASDGLGRSDTALVQRAAFALLAGDGDGGPGAITKAFGIDDVGLRQNDVGDTKETVVSVGKQLSKRVYIAYEQNLNTSTGSFQVTYRIAQRFVMRMQSGIDRSIDLIGTWRWE
jgi:translocation and assembly module TamB